MKKSGFTLAEVLITLGIIGVVSALTLPILSTRAQDQANAAKLSSTVSELENAFGMFLIDRDEADLFNILDTTDPNDSISPYIKTAGAVDINDVYDSDSPFKDASGSAYSVPDDGILMTKSGAVVFIESNESPTAADDDANGNVDTYVGDLHIDVNGGSKPNKLGKDLFSFHLGTDGILYPKGDETKQLAANGYKID